MKIIKGLFYKYFSTFHAKLILSFIFTAMFPLLLSITIALNIINTHLTKLTEAQLSSDASKFTQQLESRLEQITYIQETISALCFNSLLPSNTEREISSKSLAEYQALYSLVSSMEKTYNVERIRIYSDYIPFTANSHWNFFPLDSLEEDLFLKITSSPYSSGLNFLYPSPDADGETISFYQILRNIDRDIIAIYLIELNNPLDSDLFSSATETSISILTSDSRILFSTSDDIHYSSEISLLPLDKICFSDSHYKIVKASTYLDWFYLFETSSSKIDSVNHNLLFGHLISLSSAILLCIIIIILVPNKFSKKIKELSDKINNFPIEMSSSDDLIADILIDNQSMPIDEIDSIIIAFSNLFHNNIQLQTTLQKQELEFYKSKFSLLQAQINPHFLYNSLDTISSALLMNQNDTADKLIKSLAHFYRISLSKGKDILTIAEELEIIQSYLEIERIGYADQIEWDITCSKENSTFSIPKFTLQPIVENSIIHGNFNAFHNPLFIRIHVELTDILCITITDNGPGISEEKLEELNGLLASDNPISVTSYGLQNCCQRIRLYYGNSYGISLSNVSSGTQTLITLPPVIS